MKLIVCIISFTFTRAQNLLFIAVDDLASRLRSTGDPYAITPNLDKIYNESTVFTKHFATSPECGPSRTSMLTSLKVENHRVEHFEGFRRLNPRVITMPGFLRSKGRYFTSGVGKVFDFWNFGGRDSDLKIKPDLCTSKSIQCSFDRFYSYDEILPTCLSGIQFNTRYLYANSSNDRNLLDDCIINNAISQLRDFSRSNNRKFALFVGITKPHMPFQCKDSFYKMHENTDFAAAFNAYNTSSYFKHISHSYFKSDSREAQGYIGFKGNDASKYARAYYACVSQADEHIGRLVDELNSLQNLSNSTIVVIWGDHGFSVGERNMFGKKTLFENANKSPFMIRLPSRIHHLIKTPISNIDIFPTIANLLNVSIDHKIDGTSAIRLMNNVVDDHPVPFSSFRIYGPSSMIGISRWYVTNTTMTIHRRSSSNKLKPDARIISRVYKPDTDERELQQFINP